MSSEQYDPGILVYGNTPIDKRQLSAILNDFGHLVTYNHLLDIYVPQSGTPLCSYALGSILKDFVYDKINDENREYPIDYRFYIIPENRLYEPWYLPEKVQRAICITTMPLFNESESLRIFHRHICENYPSMSPVIVIPNNCAYGEYNEL